jgi:hypothetical protein
MKNELKLCGTPCGFALVFIGHELKLKVCSSAILTYCMSRIEGQCNSHMDGTSSFRVIRIMHRPRAGNGLQLFTEFSDTVYQALSRRGSTRLAALEIQCRPRYGSTLRIRMPDSN